MGAMKIFVKAKPRSRADKVEKIDEQNFVVAVTEPPVQGRAIAAIVKLLADYFQVSQSQIRPRLDTVLSSVGCFGLALG